MESASSWSWVTMMKVMPTVCCRRVSSSCICSRSLASRADKRLVEQQHLGPLHESARQRHALALAAGKLVGLALGEIAELHHGERFLGALARFLARRSDDAATRIRHCRGPSCAGKTA